MSWIPRFALLALTLLPLPSCNIIPDHFHSQSDENAMKNAREAIDAQNKAAPEIYAAMHKNLETYAKEENRVLKEYADTAAQTVFAYDDLFTVNAALVKLVGENGKGGEINTFLEETLPKQLQDMAELESRVKADAAATKNPLKALNDEISRTKSEINTYNSSVALLRTAIVESKSLDSTFASAVDTENPFEAVAKLTAASDKVNSKKVSFIDADGKKQELGVVKVAEDALTWFRQDEGKNPSLPRNLPKSRGIDLVVLNTALAMLELRRDVAAADLDYLQQVRTVLADAHTRAILARELARDARDTMKVPLKFQSFATFSEDQMRKARKELTESKDIESAHNSYRRRLVGLRKLAVAESNFHRSQALMKVALARVDHDRSISRSAVHDASRRAVITRSIEGLQAYHASGFKPEHAGLILHIAQVVALGTIAQKL